VLVSYLRRYVPPKRRALSKLHDLTTPKPHFFIVTNVITSNATKLMVRLTACHLVDAAA
jgi:hypothetical protein